MAPNHTEQCFIKCCHVGERVGTPKVILYKYNFTFVCTYDFVHKTHLLDIKPHSAANCEGTKSKSLGINSHSTDSKLNRYRPDSADNKPRTADSKHNSADTKLNSVDVTAYRRLWLLKWR